MVSKLPVYQAQIERFLLSPANSVTVPATAPTEDTNCSVVQSPFKSLFVPETMGIICCLVAVVIIPRYVVTQCHRYRCMKVESALQTKFPPFSIWRPTDFGGNLEFEVEQHKVIMVVGHDREP